MLIGQYILKRQMLGRGAFAKVRLTVSDGEPRAPVKRPPNSLSSYWDDAAIAGVRFGCEFVGVSNVAQRGWKGFNVQLDEVVWSECDSSYMMVMFAAAMAFFDALKVDAGKFVRLDTASREITFSI